MSNEKHTTPSLAHMRELYRTCRDPTIRSLLVEIAHYRDVVAEAERCRRLIETVWKEEVGGQLAAMYQLRLLLQAERSRADIPNWPKD